jgi:alginate O-acetyltransferase complex protein AlgI
LVFSSAIFIYVFLPLTLLGFYFLSRRGGLVAGSLWLIAASLVFYAHWKPAHLGLLAASTLGNYLIGRWMQLWPAQSRRLLVLGVAGNLTLLGYYKYAFFLCSQVLALPLESCDGLSGDLPLAISFFTFTQIAFLVDVAHRNVATLSLQRYSLFVTFFPHLIAGPIVHYHALAPQFEDGRRFRITAGNLAIGGAIFTIGLFKKVVLADRFGAVASPIFAIADGTGTVSTPAAWIGAGAYTLQIYFDFSGYSDMAIGLARMFGVGFPENFNSPYKATSLIEFWRRWHMTLSQFLRDYLYIPLGGNRHGRWHRYFNLMITMLLGGLWHGANWTFLVWGGLHGLGLVLNNLWRRLYRPATPPGRTYTVGCWLVTILFVMLCWVCFRAGSLDTAIKIYSAMIGLNVPGGILPPQPPHMYLLMLAGVAICLWLPNRQTCFATTVTGGKLFQLLRFRSDLIYIAVIALMLIASLVSVFRNASPEFLYFDF